MTKNIEDRVGGLEVDLAEILRLIEGHLDTCSADPARIEDVRSSVARVRDLNPSLR